MKKVAKLSDRPTNYEGLWLSVSKAKTFDDCKAKFRYGYILKLPRKTWSFHILGKFAHRVLELFQQARLDGDNSSDNQLMTRVFNLAAKEFKPDLKKDQKQLVYGMAAEYLQLLAEKRERGILPTVTGVERNFYIDIDGIVLLNGMIDLEQVDSDGMLHLADYKTSKSVKYLKKDFFQLLTYAYVKCIEDPTLEKIRCSYIMLRHNFTHLTKEFSRAEVLKVEDKLLKYAEKIKEEKLFRANPTKLCEYCDYVEECQDGKNYIGLNSSNAEFGATSW